MVAQIKKQNEKADELVEEQEEMVASYKTQMEDAVQKIKDKLYEKDKLYRSAINKLETKPGPPGPVGFPGKPGDDGRSRHILGSDYMPDAELENLCGKYVLQYMSVLEFIRDQMA
jgi:hypothetical protein